jgi:hypothetical protein
MQKAQNMPDFHVLLSLVYPQDDTPSPPIIAGGLAFEYLLSISLFLSLSPPPSLLSLLPLTVPSHLFVITLLLDSRRYYSGTNCGLLTYLIVRHGNAERMGRALTRRAVEILDADATQRYVLSLLECPLGVLKQNKTNKIETFIYIYFNYYFYFI